MEAVTYIIKVCFIPALSQPRSIFIFFLGPLWQTGSGWGGLFGRLASRLLPFIRTAGKTAISGLKKAATSDTVKEISRELGSTAVSGLAEAGISALRGEEIRPGLEARLGQAKNLIADKLESKLEEVKQTYGQKPSSSSSSRKKRRKKGQTGNSAVSKKTKNSQNFDLLSP